MFDAHIHSSMSFDSSVPREDVVAEAVKRGFYGLCFTDHYDVVDSYGKFVSDYDWEGTRMAQQRAFACAGGRIIVNNGIELGNAPYGFAAAESVLNAEPEVDFVLGSIHNAKSLTIRITILLIIPIRTYAINILTIILFSLKSWWSGAISIRLPMCPIR